MSNRPRLHRRMMLATLLIATSTVASIGVPDVASAAVFRSFGIRYQTDDNGAIDMFGSTLMTCPDGSTSGGVTCTTARNPTGTNSAINDNYLMVLLDADADPSTTNSSMSTVSLPSGSTVLFAGLYWGARSTAASRNQLSFRAPNQATYTTVTANQLDTSSDFYSAFADVTSTVRSAGPGDYWGGNIRATTSADRYAGWALVVVYQNAALPLRNLTVFDGFGLVQNAVADRRIDIPLSGFLAPPFGTVNAEVGVIAYEGDGGSTGDQFLLNGVVLSNAQNPSNDFFNSTISTAGVNDTARNPSYQNTFGFDVDEVSAPGILPNSATSTLVSMLTGGETFLPSTVTTQIDLYSPQFPGTTKTVVDLNGGTTQIGDSLRYTITMTNVGLDPATNAALTDAIPTGTTYKPGSIRVNGTSVTDAAGDDVGRFTGTAVTAFVGTGATAATGGTLGPNATSTVQFDVVVNNNYSGQTVSNQASLSYTAQTINRPFTFLTNIVTNPVDPLADIQIVKTASPTPFVAGSSATYLLTVTNNGPNPSTGVVVTDPLPSGFSPATITPSVGTCTNTSGTVSCQLGTLAVGASATITVAAPLAPALDPATVLTNTATVSAAVTDPVQANNSSTVAQDVDAVADLRIAKSASPSPAVPGSTLTYTVTVTNDGPSRATAVQIAEILPAALLNPTITPSSGGSCVGSTCTFAALDPGQSGTVTVVGPVASSATGSIVNGATVSSATPDNVAGNNTVTLTTPLAPSANLSITKSASPSPALAGSTVTYTITVANAGPSDASAVSVSDALPALGAVTATSTAGTCTGTTTVACSLGSLTAGGTTTITVSGTVPASQVANLSNTASVSSSTPDPVAANNSTTISTPVQPAADLSIAKTSAPNPVVAGGTITYTVTVTNNGPATAQSVSMTDVVPGQLNQVAATSSSFACTGTATVTCTQASLASGASATITITGTVPNAQVANLTPNTATVTTTSNDPNTANNTATVTTSVTTIADLRLTKAASAPTAVAGTSVTYTVAVTNAGPSNATNYTVVDTIPSGLTPLSATIGASPCSISGQTVTCSGTSLASSTSQTITITAAIADNAPPGTVTNTATITAQGTADPTTSNNAASASVTVTQSADLTITKTAVTNPVVPGLPATFTLAIDNLGPSDAAGTVAGDPLPTGYTLGAGTDPRCQLIGGSITCSLGTILADAPGELLTVVVVPPAGTPSGSLVNTATLTSSVPDPTPASSSVTVPITPIADLTVTKSDAPDPAVAGEPLTYTITIRNAGPSSATSVALSDPGLSALTGLSLAPSQGNCSVATRSCTLGTLAPGSTIVVTATGIVPPATADSTTLVNTVTVSSPADTTPATATATTLVRRSADVAVLKSADPTTVRAGDPVSWTITASNTGPSVADNVVITDTLPTGLVLATTTISASAGSCTRVGVAISCSVSSIPDGGTVSVVVTAQVDPASTVASVTNNTAVTSTTNDSDSSDNQADSTVAVVAAADLTITKAPSAPTAVAGDVAPSGAALPGPFTWVVQIVNKGPSTARTVSVADLLPAAFTALQVSTTVGTCTGTSSIACDLGDLPIGSLVTITVNGRFAADATGTITNTASLTTLTPDPVPGGESATASVALEAVADLSITKTPVSSPFVAGSPASWTVTVTNAGPSTATGVSVSDTLPSTGFTGATATTTAGTCASATACTLSPITPGGSATITVSGTVSPAFTAATMSNTATVSSPVTDPDLADRTATSTVPVAPVANLSIVKVALNEPFVPGQPVSWRLSITNNGPSNAAGVTVADTLPAGSTITTATASSGTCTGAGSSNLTCNLGTLNAGVTRTVTIVAALPPGVAPGTLDNTATVSATTSDPVPSNNSGSDTAAVVARADMSIAKAFVGPVVAGQPVTWTITVSNAGPSDATGVTVSDLIPAGVVVSTLPVACSGTTTVTCGATRIAPGASQTFTVVGALSPDARGTLTNTASVVSDAADPTPGNNTATATSPITVTSAVVIDKIAPSPVPVPGGAPGRWTITFTNAGPSTANGVVLVDPISNVTAVTLGSATTSGSCTTAVVCAIGDVPPGVTITVLVDVSYPASTPEGTISNTASVTATSPLTGTTSDTATFDLLGSADLALTKTFSPAVITAGQTGQYVLAISNAGPSDATSVVVADTLPVGVASATLAAPVPLGCTLSTVPIRVSCTGLTIAPGTTVTVVVDVVTLGVLGPDDLDNSAAVTSATSDPNPSDNTAAVMPEPTNSADVSLTKSVDAGPFVAGGPTVHTWTLTTSNAGPSTAVGVVVTDVVPAGVAITPPSGCSFAGQTLTCSPVNLPNGGSIVVVIPFTVDAAAPAGPISNRADANSATTPDPSPGNNTAQAAATVERSTDIDLTKSASPATVTAGQPVTWTVDGTVVGPSTAEATSFSDSVPSGFVVTSATVAIDGGVPVSCAVTGQLVGCPLGTLDPGSTFRVVVDADVAATLAATTYANTANVSTITPGGTASATGPVTVDRQSPLTIAKVALGGGPFVAGTPLDWTITITNPGPSTGEAVAVTDVAPPGYTITSLTSTQGTCGATGCALGTLPVGASATITVRGTIDPAAPAGTIANSAEVTAQDLATPVAVSAPAEVTRSAALRFDKTASPVVAVAGEALTYTLTITNDGPSTSEQVVVTDNLPAGFLAGPVTPPAGTTYAAPTWTIPVLSPGQTVTLVVPGLVESGFTAPTIDNAATLTSATPGAGDTTAAVSTPVLVHADVAVSKQTLTTTLVAGLPVSWQITVDNIGPSDAADVVISDSLPPGVVLGSETFVLDPVTAGTCDASSGVCSLGVLTAGSSVTITVSAVLDQAITDGTSITNVVTATTTSPDVDSANDTASTTDTVTARAALTIAKATLDAPVVAGELVTYEITVTNPGPSDALDVVVTDSPPAPLLNPVATSATATCAGLTCTIPTLPAGETATVRVTGTLDPATGGAVDVRNDASVSSPTDPGAPRAASVTDATVTSADIEIVKTVVTDPVVAGQAIEWLITVTNHGPSDALPVSVVDTPPAQTSSMAYTPSVGACTTAGQCSLGTMAAGATETITVTGIVPASIASGSVITNAAGALSATPDPFTLDNNDSVDGVVTALADLSVTKTGPTSVVPGQTVTWTITVDNTAGPSDALNVIVGDTLPANVAGATVSSSQGNCSALPCNIGTVANGATATVTVTATVDQATLLDVTNAATVASDTPDPNTADNRSQVTSSSDPTADVRVSKTLTTNPVVAGLPIAWRITVTNDGPSQALGVVVTDTAPVRVPDAAATIAPADGSCSGLTCLLAPIPTGASVTIDVAGTLDADAPAGSTVTNTAQIDSATTPDPDTANNIATTPPAPVTTSADLEVTKVLDTATIVAGQPVRWTILVTNHGPSDAQGVAINDAIPTGVTNVAFTPSAGTCQTNGSCTVPTLAADGVVAIVVTALVPPSADPASTISNSVGVLSTTPDPDGADNTATAPAAPVTTSADLTITKLAPVTAVPGTPLTWTIDVVNAGPSDARDVIVADALPAGILAPVVQSTQGACIAFACTLGTVVAGTTARITVTGTVDPAALGQLLNTASVTTTTPDPNTGGESSTATTTLLPSADVSVTKRLDTSPVVAGQPVQWTMTVANSGPSDGRAVTVDDTLPAGSTISSISNGACAGTGSAVLTCAFDPIPAGGTEIIVLVADVAADLAAGPFDNTATVTSTTGDPVSANNSATAAADSTTSADLLLVKSLLTSPVVAGEPVAWTLDVTNLGPSDAQSVTIADPVPASVTLAALPVGCSGSTSISCIVPVLVPGGSASFTITGTLSPDARGALVNSATVSSTTPDPTSANNGSSVTAPIEVTSAVTITKTAPSPAPVPGGAPGRWTITLTNAGPSTANGVAIDDAISLGTVLGVGSTSGTCDLAIHCTIGDLPPGAGVTVLVDVQYPADAPVGQVDNTAAVSALTPITGTLSATDSFDLQGLADLDVRKTITPNPLIAGTSGQYRIELHNAGPSDTAGVDLSDTLPPGVATASLASGPSGCVVTLAPAVQCTGLAIPSGATRIVLVDITASGVLTPGDLDNTATVTALTADPDTTNNQGVVTPNVDNSADVVHDKAVTSGPYVAGSGTVHTWILSVRNVGPSTALGVELADLLPPGITPGLVTSGTVAAGALNCAISGPVLACDPFDLLVGESVEVSVEFTVDPGTAAGPISNRASAVATTADPSAQNNVDAATIAVARSVAIDLVKSGPASVTAGTTVAWTIDATVNGPSTAEATSLSDTVPVGFTPSSAVVSGDVTASCDITGRLVSCALGTLDPGTHVTLTIVADLDPGQATGPLVNTAAVSTVTPGGNATADLPFVVVRSAPLEVDKVALVDDGRYLAGESMQWLVTVHNPGPSSSVDVVVTELAPAPLTVLSLAPSQGSCTGTACQLGTIPVGSDATVLVTVQVAPDTPAGTVTNVVSVSAAELAAPVSADADATIEREASLRITKSATPDPAVAGTPLTWTITVGNDGPSTSEAVVVTDALPASMLSPTITPSVGSLTGDDWSVGTLAVGATETLTISGVLDPASTDPTIANSATVTSSTPNPGQTSATVVTPVVVRADLAISKRIVTSPVIAGQPVEWEITVVNNGPSTAVDTQVVDTLAAGLTAGSAVIDPADGTCAGSSCSIPVLTPGQSVTIAVTALLDPNTPDGTSIVNRATAISSTPDPDVTNNAVVTSPAEVNATADLAVVLTAPVSAVPGTSATWTFSVTNNGPSDAVNVVVRFPVPAGVTIDATLLDPGCVLAAGMITCTIPVLPVGQSATFDVTGPIDAASTSPIASSVSVGSDTTDPAPVDNTDSGSTRLTPIADLSVTKVGPATVVAGTTAVWTVSVANAGPSSAVNVRLSDVLPAGVASASVDSSLCSVAQLTVSCTWATLAPGARVDVVITATLETRLPASQLVNTVSVSSPTTDPVLANNTASATSAAAQRYDLSIVKSVSDDAVDYWGTTTFTLRIANAGPSLAESVTVHDTVPAGLEVVSVTSPQPCTRNGQDIDCTAGSLDAGVAFDVMIMVRGTQPGRSANTATVHGANDTNTANDVASAAATVLDAAELIITKTAVTSTVAAGGTLEWTVTVRNVGPSIARSVTVAERPSSGLTIVRATPSVGTWDAATSTWSIPELAAGAVVTMSVQTAATTAGLATNTVTASSSTPDAAAARNGTVGRPISTQAASTVTVTERITPPTGSSGTLPLTDAALVVLAAGGMLVAVTRRRHRAH